MCSLRQAAGSRRLSHRGSYPNTCSVCSMRDPPPMSTEERVLLVSIRPRFADLLLEGSKTVELRRVRPNVTPGTAVILYASSPVCEIVGTASVAAIHEADPTSIWEHHGRRTGLDRSEFDSYFAGTDVAIGIEL